ncbi:hypothetical protein [Rhodocyclus tenuis]|uniref:Uncharacterized protein n=1 Tax=Rhodocyclus tenuis TaxID=1066 RepID=A0A840G094_RHOTE|nr:hypothetical protein [Rhodocyclus tenuis]MBB4247594.1 hypothetical protein [Rhodocyclus tenuis]
MNQILPAKQIAPDQDCLLAAATLNHECLCPTLDLERLPQALASRLPLVPAGSAVEDPLPGLLATHAHLFSPASIYVAEADLQAMRAGVEAIERVIATPAFRQQALAQAPAIAQLPQAAAGVFLGYDFHLGDDGPRLIEINTNAGGALLNALVAALPRAACAHHGALLGLSASASAGTADHPLPDATAATPSVTDAVSPATTYRDPASAPTRFLAMFREEWRRARGARPLRRIAIVDAAPAGQFLAAEFECFRRLFESDGIAALIADPDELAFDGSVLSCRGEPVDLVYNRLTDFALNEPAQAALRAAYLADAVLLTPHPQAHALYADKRNLCLLSDDAWLAAAGVDAADRARLAAIVPHTAVVTPENADTFWNERRQYFFKPWGGYGGKAAYRGDKLTRRVFGEIAAGGYVAQQVAPPSLRRVRIDGEARELKLDLRLYVYAGEVQLVAARLYQGQTTNFRTHGGGFATVIEVLCAAAMAASAATGEADVVPA